MKIIADCCANHLNDVRVIGKMVTEAKNAGVDLLKFQLFTADKLEGEWREQYKYYKDHEIGNPLFNHIISTCRVHGVAPLFTLFDPEKEKWLHDAGLNMVKVGSAEAHHKDWVLGLAERFETVFVSCGMINDDLIREYRKVPNIKLFYCISKYPLTIDEIDFKALKYFDGFSDHTQDISASKQALDCGVEYIERHYTLGKYLPGKDHKISSTPDEFQELVNHRNYIQGKKKFQTRWRF